MEFHCTLFFNNSNYLLYFEQMNHSIQIVVITNFVVISNVGIKRIDCTLHYTVTGTSSHILSHYIQYQIHVCHNLL